MKRKPPEGNVRRVASIDRNFRGITTNKCGRIGQFESQCWKNYKKVGIRPIRYDRVDGHAGDGDGV